MRARRRPWLPAFFLALALLSILAIGSLKLRRDFLTRGIPEELPPPTAHGGAALGLNVYLGQYEKTALEDVLDQMAATGITTVKQPFYYREPFDWAMSDRLIRAAAAKNLCLVPLLDGNPEQHFAPPDDPALFAAWAGAFAARYADELRYYFVWDEPNLANHWGNQNVNPAAYAALLSATAAAIRSNDPDAVIVAAPLAPTVEKGPANLADPLYLQRLYDAGAADAFDVVAAKPYGFYSGPSDRRVARDTLNFSRVILLREVMLQNGDEQKAVWAGNWGWNSLPPGWQGAPSLWGQTDEQQQAAYTIAALQRARREWPWMGIMFLENWEPAVPPTDPRWGFSIAGRALEQALRVHLPQENLAYPGFHLAQEGNLGQTYQGNWQFSPAFGADISESGDRAELNFWGTDVGLRVRRAGYRARLYVSVDGEDANALPHDGRRTALVLTVPDLDPASEYLSTDLVAQNLAPGPHTLTLEADRGWGQWALNGFSVAYQPSPARYRLELLALGSFAALSLLLAAWSARHLAWVSVVAALSRRYGRFGERSQLLLTALVAGMVALAGWLTWGEQAAGLYRRLGDGSQVILTAAVAAVFYVTPVFFVYVAALLLLFFLIYARPAWGLALIAFTFPFYVVPKPMLGYRFSPVEIFTLVTVAATALAWATAALVDLKRRRGEGITPSLTSMLRSSLLPADFAVLAFVTIATLSLLFTERLDVATNEWRVVIVEPALFYLLVRAIRPKEREMWTVLDAFILGGLTVALYGLWKFALGENVITVAGGLARLRSLYGSPNNVALYLGRIFPFLVAMFLMGEGTSRRRLLYVLALVPTGLALLLTFSKGALFLGVPAALFVVLFLWQRSRSRPLWPWLVAVAILALAGALLLRNVPSLVGRLDIQGTTSFARIHLWRSSLNMFADHPLFGVGLDNFLYQYRGRYILGAAWAEPDLSHPHNVVLDFATRLGILGLLAGGWLFGSLLRNLWSLPAKVPPSWRPVAAGLAGAFTHMLAHGLVDHSFFLVDLAYAFFLMLGVSTWLRLKFVT